MNCFGRTCRRSAALVILFAVTHAAADDQFDLVPDSASIVIGVPSVEKLAVGISGFGKAIGSREIADVKPLNLVENLIPVLDGIKLAGPMLVIFVPSGDYNASLVVIGLSDASTWKKAVSAAEVENQKDLLKITAGGDEGFAAIVGEFLVASEDEDAVKSALRSKKGFREKSQGHFADAYQKSHAAVLIDLEALRKPIEDGLGRFEQLMQMGMAMSGGAQTEAGMGMVKAGLSGLRDVILDASIMTAGVTIDSDGVRLVDVCSFRPNSDTAEYLKKLKPGSNSPLRGVADGPFFGVFGVEWQTPPNVQSLSEKLMHKMAEAIPAESPERKSLEQALVENAEMYKWMTGYNAAFSATPGSKGMLFSGAYLTTQPEKTASSMRGLMSKSAAFMNMFVGGIKSEVEHKREHIGDKEVDAYALRFSGDDPNTASITQVYGENPTLFAMPRKDDVIFAMSGHDTAKSHIERVLSGYSKELTGNKRVVEALKSVSPNPQGCILLDLGEFIRFGAQAAEASGMPIPPIEIDTEGAALPVATVYLSEDRFRTEVFVPADAIRRLVAAFAPFEAPEPK